MIVHLDGDSFFVSCELLARPDLRGRPVITGGERGIASSMNQEAKAIGITRGMPVFEIRKKYGEKVVVLPSNFSLYSEYNKRTLRIVKRFADEVEDYSIDECFVFLDEMSIQEAESLARKIKDTIQKELGLTYSLGLAPTKVLAKVASKNRKPNGFTVMDRESIPKFLETLKVEDVWGVGRRMKTHFNDVGIYSAYDLARKSKEYIEERFALPYQTIWYELNGVSVMAVGDKNDRRKSIQTTRMFPKNSSDKAFVFSHLSRNIEIAASRLRRMGLYTNSLSIFIQDKDMRRHSIDVDISEYTNLPHIIIGAVKPKFDIVFNKQKIYRSSGITCTHLLAKEDMTLSLFEDEKKHDDKLYKTLDKLRDKMGDHVVVLASSMNAMKSYQDNEKKLYIREKELPVPYMGEVG